MMHTDVMMTDIKSRRRGFWQKGLALLVLMGLTTLIMPTVAVYADTSYPFSIFPNDVLPTFTYKEFNVVQPNSPYLQIAPTSGQSFTEELDATTPASLTLPTDDSSQYAVTVQAPISVAVAQNDVLDVSFWLRQVSSSAGQAQATVSFQHSSGDYAKSLTRHMDLSTNWTQYHYTFKVVNSYAPGEAELTFWLGYAPPQTVAIGGIVANDLGPNATVPAYTYDGRDPNASWRASAQQRIEQYREGNLNVSVVDQSGNPLPNAGVHVQLVNNAFKFGSAVDAYRIDDTTNNTDDATYRAKITQLFNYAVMENDLKWPEWEDVNAQVTQTLPAIQCCRVLLDRPLLLRTILARLMGISMEQCNN